MNKKLLKIKLIAIHSMKTMVKRLLEVIISPLKNIT